MCWPIFVSCRSKADRKKIVQDDSLRKSHDGLQRLWPDARIGKDDRSSRRTGISLEIPEQQIPSRHNADELVAPYDRHPGDMPILEKICDFDERLFFRHRDDALMTCSTETFSSSRPAIMSWSKSYSDTKPNKVCSLSTTGRLPK